MGLLAGTVLGAGLGMLFAPKAGSDLRNQLTEQAGKLRHTATDTYQHASERVTQIVDKGREAYDRARGNVSNMPQSATGTRGDRHHRNDDKSDLLDSRFDQPAVIFCNRGTGASRHLSPCAPVAFMTTTTARRLADGILVAAALGAAYYIVKTPRLRRMAIGLAATALTRTMPEWLSAEIGRAWAETDRLHLRQGSGGQAACSPGLRRAKRYDDGVTAQAARGASMLRRALTRVRAEIRLTALAIWRGVLGFYNSDDLTFAASIAYYALLSLFPFPPAGLLDPRQRDQQSRRIARRSSSSCSAISRRQFEFVTDADGLAAAVAAPARRRRQLADDLGRDGRLRRDDVRRSTTPGASRSSRATSSTS